MKKTLIVLLSLITLYSCKPTEKPTQAKVDDGDVLRPPEGYGNDTVIRRNKAAALNQMRMLEARPAPCVTVAKPDSVTVTLNTATIKWPAYPGINKFYVYKSKVQGQVGAYDGQSSSTQYTGSGMAPGETVYYTVAAIARGNKPCTRSPEIRMTTTQPTNPPPPPPPPPSGGTKNLALLMFDPITITGTSWGASITSPGAGFTEEQKLECFEHAKAIYAKDHPWLSFTMDKSVYDAADPSSRVMCVYTEDATWYGTAGGVAYINSYGTSDNVCWVFTKLLNYSAFNASLADIHELGHTLGLYHTVTDTVCSIAYGYAVLCGDQVWRAPIMGGSYTPYEHIFYTPAKGNSYGILWKQRNDCTAKDEDAIIDTKRK